MSVTTADQQEEPRSRFSGFSWELAFAVLIYGLATGLGLSAPVLVVAVVAPYLLMMLLSRPHWIVPFYVPVVFADLLSIATRYHGIPPLARFAGLFLLAAVLAYRIVIKREWIPRDEMNWWMVAYGVVLTAGLLYAVNTEVVMENIIEFVRAFITYLIVICMVTTRARLRGALWSILIIATIIGAISIVQALTGNYDNDFGGLAQSRVSEITSSEDAARPGGVVGDANYHGQWLMLALPIGLFMLFQARHPFQRLAGLFSSAILTLAVILTYSRGDAVALGAIFVMVVIYKRPKPALILAGIVAVLIALPLLPGGYTDRLLSIFESTSGNRIYTEYSIRGRLFAYTAAIDMFLDHPIVGVGRENYTEHQLDYAAQSGLAYKSQSIPPHDLYLEIAAEHGLLGIFVFGGLLFSAATAIIEAKRRFDNIGDERHAELAVWMGIALAGYLISSIFLHGAFLYMLWLLVTMIVALRQVAKTVSPSNVSRTVRAT